MAPSKSSNGSHPAISTNGHRRSNSKDGKAKWTIMIYLAGDGTLSAHCISVLQQLEKAASEKSIRLLACYDSNTPAPKGSRYLDIRQGNSVKNGLDWGLHNFLIPPTDRGHAIVAPNFCDQKTDKITGNRRSRPTAAEGVKRFINWAVYNHEAERYMLVFLGHGPIVASQTFLSKENPPSFLKLGDLSRVLSEQFGPRHQRKLSILACNNCVMNGIETAIEVKDQADYMIGSQGLMLAAGWPYEEIIGAIVDNPEAETGDIARKILEACARNLLDFTLMERSSEQSVCDLKKLSEQENVVTAVRGLVRSLKKGLEFTEKDGKPVLRYPTLCDAVKLARLEAQSYWSETFVDLSDFCERLMRKCDELVLLNSNLLKELGFDDKVPPKTFRTTKALTMLKEVACACNEVIRQVRCMVPESYYIGPELQYSHGLSIYFPWTRPESPYFFTRRPQGRDYWLHTAFETYRKYKFAKRSQWTEFLQVFFRATLRKMRRADRTFHIRGDNEQIDSGLIGHDIVPQSEMLAIDLQKSSSDTGQEQSQSPLSIKNYPRRNYLSPADCPRKIDEPGNIPYGSVRFLNSTDPPVSYLGWNISGIVAKVIQPTNGLVDEGSARPKMRRQPIAKGVAVGT